MDEHTQPSNSKYQTKENKALNDKNVEPLRFNTLHTNCSQKI